MSDQPVGPAGCVTNSSFGPQNWDRGEEGERTLDYVLVTGGAGFIGSHTCKALAKRGFAPVVFDSLERGTKDAVLWGPLVVGDLRDERAIRSALITYRPTAVLHFAGYTYVGESVARPSAYYENNVAGTLTLLKAMRESQVSQIVFSSTCATYGTPLEIPIPESHPQVPVSPYGWTKLMVERILIDLCAAQEIRAIILRYFNAAGSDPDCDVGERHEPETHLMPLALDVARGKQPYLTINGTDYPTPDGTCIRDYIHVSDLADAHVLALMRLLSGTTYRALNLSNGVGFSVREILSAITDVTGLSIPTRVGARREGDAPILVGDATAARDFLGWRPNRGDIKTQIEDAWRWRAMR